jgi:uncharacterized protein YqhQ
MLWDAMVLGTRSLMWSADVSLSDDEDVQFTGPVAWTTVALSLAVAIGLFFFLPAAAGKWLETRLGVSPVTGAFIEGLIRLALFLTYLVLIGRMADIRRVFQYHGAEHKTINAYEDGAPMTPASVARYSVQHPRCGTSFLLIVMLVSIAVFSLIPKLWPFIFKAGSRIVLLPLIAGISYEFLKWSAKHDSHPLVGLIIAPGLALQRLTTGEPDDAQLEVAIRSLNEALEVNEGYADDRIVV